jgi:hypothetical protein
MKTELSFLVQKITEDFMGGKTFVQPTTLTILPSLAKRCRVLDVKRNPFCHDICNPTNRKRAIEIISDSRHFREPSVVGSF